MRIGVLVGGGDAPGLNAALKAVVTKAHEVSFEVMGIKRGWAGLLEADAQTLDLDAVEEIQSRGGIILYTSRTNPFQITNGPQTIIENMRKLKIDALVAIGGEDTLSVAQKLFEMKVPMVGVPKTIDNDLSETDYSIGFDTSVSIATDAIDRLRTTAEAHYRIIVVEVMGRHSGWIALHSGLAGGANMILIPEVPFNPETIYELVKNRRAKGKVYSIITVAEGAKTSEDQHVVQSEKVDAFGHVRLGGIGQTLERLIEENTGLEARLVVLGHLQRGGPPTAFDRVLAIRLGIKAVELVKEKRFGQMSSFRGYEIASVPLKEAIKRKDVSLELYKMAQLFFR